MDATKRVSFDPPSERHRSDDADSTVGDEIREMEPTAQGVQFDTWQVVGAADWNSDGNVDEVWRRSTDGVTVAVLLSGVTITNALAMFNLPDVNWRPVSFADLNGDGKPDLVLRNQATGVAVVLYQDGVTVIGAAVLPAVPDLSWAIVGPR